MNKLATWLPLIAGLAVGCSSSSEPAPSPKADVGPEPKAGVPKVHETAAGTPPTFASVSKLLQANCVGCHSGDKAKAKLSLVSLDTIKTGGENGPAIKPGDGEGSLMVQYLRGVKKPRMPFKKTPLSDADINAISAWIQAGAKND